MAVRFVCVLMALAVAATARSAEADSIRIASSSTVFPFLAAAAEHFGRTGGFRTPVIESIGSGGALKLFCAAGGAGSADLAGSSRRITAAERQRCAANDVGALAELVIGYDGIVLANGKSAAAFRLSRQQLFRAIARRVPVNGKLVANPYRQWNEIDPSLPRQDIMIYGPAPNHGTRDVLGELVMQPVCASLTDVTGLPAAAHKAACEALREDGRFIEVTEDYSVILQRLDGQPQALGLLPFSFLAKNGDRVKAAAFEGRAPDYDAIFSGAYALSRPLYVYVKKGHLGRTDGLREFLVELTSPRAAGADGYLLDKGLIALPEAERAVQARRARDLPDLAQ